MNKAAHRGGFFHLHAALNFLLSGMNAAILSALTASLIAVGIYSTKKPISTRLFWLMAVVCSLGTLWGVLTVVNVQLKM